MAVRGTYGGQDDPVIGNGLTARSAPSNHAGVSAPARPSS
jgi:hypothetical protein